MKTKKIIKLPAETMLFLVLVTADKDARIASQHFCLVGLSPKHPPLLHTTLLSNLSSLLRTGYFAAHTAGVYCPAVKKKRKKWGRAWGSAYDSSPRPDLACALGLLLAGAKQTWAATAAPSSDSEVLRASRVTIPFLRLARFLHRRHLLLLFTAATTARLRSVRVARARRVHHDGAGIA